MIYKLDHISIGSNQFEKDINTLKEYGYKDEFIEKKLVNMENTKYIMDDFAEDFSMCLMHKKDSFSIEILDYQQKISDSSERVNITSYDSSGSEIKDLTQMENNNLNVMRILTNDLDGSTKFWQNFRFKVIQINNENVLLEFKNAMPKQLFYIELINSSLDTNQKISINEHNFNLVAFITTSIQKDRQKLLEEGYMVTDINDLKVNSQNLEICFIYSQNNELVELIGLK